MPKGFFSRVIEYVGERTADIIGRILSFGVNKSEIARTLDIDSSTISQVMAGKKPGENLAAPLLELERKLAGEQAPKEAIKDYHLDIPRRLTREGAIARVRESSQEKAEREREEREAADRRAEAERQAARDREFEAVMEGGMTVTVSGVMGTSDDFRQRTVEADLDPDDAAEFLGLWNVDQKAALDLFFDVYGAPLSVRSNLSIQFS